MTCAVQPVRRRVPDENSGKGIVRRWQSANCRADDEEEIYRGALRRKRAGDAGGGGEVNRCLAVPLGVATLECDDTGQQANQACKQAQARLAAHARRGADRRVVLTVN